jgi:hypothetical protein
MLNVASNMAVGPFIEEQSPDEDDEFTKVHLNLNTHGDEPPAIDNRGYSNSDRSENQDRDLGYQLPGQRLLNYSSSTEEFGSDSESEVPPPARIATGNYPVG